VERDAVPEDTDAAAEEPDALQDEAKREISSLKEEVERLKRLLRQKDEELEQLYLDRRKCIASTEGGQLLEHEEKPPRFSMWQKVKYVAGGVFVGLVSPVLAMVGVEITFTENTDWEIRVGLES
jgi:hypothetical protein